VADCSLVVGTTAARNRRLDHKLRPIPEGARAIRRRLCLGRVALLFGSEKRGLSNHDLSHCHWLVRIPTKETHPSMNLGQAVAVCLYEIAGNGKLPPRSVEQGLALSGTLERLNQILLDALRTSGYLGADSQVATEEKIRRLVRRLKVSEEDAQV